MRKTLTGAALGAALLAGTAAQAATLFYEDFADEATTFGTALNFTSFDQFNVSDGTVDLIAAGNGFGITCATVGCVDLDGSTGNSGFLSAPLTFLGGVQYTVSALMSGNQRSQNIENVQFGVVGGASFTTPLLPGNTFTEFTLSFTSANALTGALFFQDQGNDNIGAILDRVSVTYDDQSLPPVPLPASALLLLGGMGGLGALGAARRTRR